MTVCYLSPLKITWFHKIAIKFRRNRVKLSSPQSIDNDVIRFIIKAWIKEVRKENNS